MNVRLPLMVAAMLKSSDELNINTFIEHFQLQCKWIMGQKHNCK